MRARHPHPLPVGPATPSRSAQWVQLSTMPRHHVAYPPYRALPPPPPYRMGRHRLQPVSRSCLNTWEQRTRRWMARSNSAPALRLWLAHVSHAQPPAPPAHTKVPRERCLCAARPLGAASQPPQPGGHPHGVLPQLDGHGRGRWMGAVTPQRVPQGVAVSWPALHEALMRPSTGAMARQPRSGGCPASTGGMARSPLWWPPCWHPFGTWVPSLSAAAEPPSQRPRPAPPQGRVLLIDGWNNEAECCGGHWVGVTHGGTIRCLSRGDKSLAVPPDLHAASGAVLASIPRVYAVWYAVLPAPGSHQPPPQHE